MKTYLTENRYKALTIINQMIDSASTKEEGLKEEWKLKVLLPYFQFLSELERIKKYSWIDTTSRLKVHSDFIDKIVVISENADKGELPSEKFSKHLNDMISDWLNHNLDSVLKEEEHKFYSRIAWQDEPLENDEKKETPLQKKKAEANITLRKTKHVNF